MSPEAWLSNGVGAVGVLLALLGLWRTQNRDGQAERLALLERLIRLEERFALYGPWIAARMLHSPHNPYGIDNLLDQFSSESFETSADIRALAQRLLWVREGDARAFASPASTPEEVIPARHRLLAAEVLEELERRYGLPPAETTR